MSDTERLDGIEWFGCMTGDCPHWKQSECDVAILGVVRSVLAERRSAMTRGDNDGEVWVPCTPELLASGVSCAATERRPGHYGVGHDHLVLATPSTDGLAAALRELLPTDYLVCGRDEDFAEHSQEECEARLRRITKALRAATTMASAARAVEDGAAASGDG